MQTNWYCSPRALSSGRIVIALSSSHHIADTPIPWLHLWPYAGLDPECPFLSYKERISNVSQQCLLEERMTSLEQLVALLPMWPRSLLAFSARILRLRYLKISLGRITCHPDRRLRLISFKILSYTWLIDFNGNLALRYFRECGPADICLLSVRKLQQRRKKGQISKNPYILDSCSYFTR